MMRFVIIGNGLAGHTAALELRKLNEQASITLIGEEPGLPYDRPPLTKQFLLGEAETNDVILKSAAAYSDLGIEYLPSTRATKIDRQSRTVATLAGSNFHYDRLLLAVGSRPQRLDHAPATRRVSYIRTLADAGRLRETLRSGGHLVVVGGGFIGLEVAAAARKLGCRVSVVEASDRLLSRGVPPAMGHYAYDLHARQGVEIHLGQAVHEIHDKEGARILVRCAAGQMEADAAVIGIGVVPNTELAEAAGLEVSDGVVVDRECRTSDPDIFAAGEVTAHPSGRSGGLRRVESWHVAAEQPRVAAGTMSGRQVVFDEPPWLWSDQYDANIQVIGNLEEGKRCLVSRTGEGRWTLIGIGDDGVPLGGIAVNNGRHISMLRRALRSGTPLPESATSDFVEGDEQLWVGGSIANARLDADV